MRTSRKYQSHGKQADHGYSPGPRLQRSDHAVVPWMADLRLSPVLQLERAVIKIRLVSSWGSTSFHLLKSGIAGALTAGPPSIVAPDGIGTDPGNRGSGVRYHAGTLGQFFAGEINQTRNRRVRNALDVLLIPARHPPLVENDQG